VARIVGPAGGVHLGRYMAWASIGSGVSCGLTSACVHALGERAIFPLAIAWSIALCAVLALCPAVRDEPRHGARARSATKGTAAAERFAGWLIALLGVLGSPAFLALAVLTLAAGYARSVPAMYLPFYLRAVGWSEPSVGFVYFFRVVCEALLYPACDLAARAFGRRSVFAAGLLAGGARCLLYASVDGPLFDEAIGKYYALAVELLKGASTAFVIYAGKAMASAMAPDECRSTVHGAFSGLFGSGATALAGLAGWSRLHPDAAGHHPHAAEPFRALFSVAGRWVLAALPLVMALPLATEKSATGA
jgi:hypothetical protein